MHVVVAGGSGFLGSALSGALRRGGHRVTILTTRQTAAPGQVTWRPGSRNRSWTAAFRDADAVVNLAGASIAGQRWTAARKALILASRLDATRALAGAINASGRSPVFVSSSGVGYYGLRGAEPLTERAEPGSDFLANVCRAWEDEARTARAAARVILIRTGLVLDRTGGALPTIALPFRLGVGGPLGSGRQYMSWVHVDDWVGIVVRSLAEESARGPVNVTAPGAVTNAEFSRTLGRILRRPAIVPAPAFALRLALGDMADALLLGGQRAVPEAALAMGYAFQYPTLEPALRAVYSAVR